MGISQPTTSKSHTSTEKGKSTNAPKDFEIVVIITETTHDTTSPFHNLEEASSQLMKELNEISG